MRDFVGSKEFHRRLRKLLAPRFAELGWKPRGRGRCVFVRGSRSFWIQLSKYSNALGGGKFTIHVGSYRILRRLSASDREVGKTLEAHLVVRLPRPDPDPEVDGIGENGEPVRIKLGDAVRTNPWQWEGSRDIWLHYFVKEDLDDWAAFLVPRLNLLTGFWLFEVFDPLLWADRAKGLAQVFRSKPSRPR